MVSFRAATVRLPPNAPIARERAMVILGCVLGTESIEKLDSHHPNLSPVISGYKKLSKSAQSIEITGFIEKSKPPEIIFFYTLLPLTA